MARGHAVNETMSLFCAESGPYYADRVPAVRRFPSRAGTKIVTGERDPTSGCLELYPKPLAHRWLG